MLTLLLNVSILFLFYQPERMYPFLCLHNLFYTTTNTQQLLNDEVIIECDKDQSLEDIASLIVMAPNWMPDSNLRANGYECSFYQKNQRQKTVHYLKYGNEPFYIT